jgi:hypothetical protein
VARKSSSATRSWGNWDGQSNAHPPDYSEGCAGYITLDNISAMPISDPHAKNLRDMLEAAEESIAKRRHVPAMVLIYSLIDSLAWAGADRQSPNLRSRFEDWVRVWLIPLLSPSTPPVTETDLYAARCGMLHTGTGVSDLYLSGKARRILYAWGKAKVEVLEYAISTTEEMKNHVALHYDDLFRAARTGLGNFLAAADLDPRLKSRIEEASSFQYMSVPHTEPRGEGDVV